MLPSIFLAKIIHNLSMNGSDVQVLSTAKKIMYLQTEIFYPLIQESSFFHFKFLFSYFSLDIKVVFCIA